jgi:PAS domain S-box-containing protein
MGAPAKPPYPGAEMTAGHLTELDVPTLWSALEAAAEQASLAVYVARIDCSPPRMIYVSDRAAMIIGRPQPELIGSLPWAILIPEDQPRIRDLVARPPGAPPLLIDATVLRPDGTLVPIECAATRINTRDGILTFGYFRDVTAERATLAALRQSEARFRFLVEAAPDGVVILVRGKVVFINPRAARLLGVPEGESAVGHYINEYLPPADAKLAGERIMEMFRSGKEMPPNEYGVVADPDRVVEIKSIACEWDGGPAVLALARDVTERKAIQRRLVEADRLAALGTLAAGVAHEINNPMTYALLAVQRIERTVSQLGLPGAAVSSIREQLGDIEHGIGRVASITRSLRAFARPDDAPPGPVDLSAVIARSLRMVDNDLRHRAQLVVELPEIPWVIGNASRLEQVLVNVLINAIQSLPEPGPHQITVTLQRADDQVTLSIRDTGRGMSAAIRDRIFEPFFTTRPIGEGMGLGLSVSKTIVEGFGGTLAVVSAPGAGTTVTIALKVHAGPRPEPATLTSTEPPTRRTILLIDDEPVLRNVFSQLLSRQHDVMTCASGAEALLALQAGEFDVIVCDVMMQGMNGCELYRRIAVDHPGHERRVVFITGGTFTRDIDDFLASTPNRILTKPFNLESILATIEHVARTPGT